MNVIERQSETPWCVITGVTSGIGLALAKQLLERGERVVGVGRNRDILAELESSWSGRFTGVAHDVSRGGLLEQLVASKVALSEIDLVVHSAGCAAQGSTIVDMPESDILEIISTNVVGTTLVVREMAGVLRARGKGTLIAVGSIAGHDSAPLMAAYSASKAYVEQLVRSVRSDLHEHSLRFACVHPGTTRTGLLEGQPGLSSSERYSGFTPLEAEDVARTILWIYNQPPHVNVQDISIYPVAQSLYVRGVHRKVDHGLVISQSKDRK